MEIDRKSFIRLGVAGATGSVVPHAYDVAGNPSLSAAQARPKKQEGAAIRGATDAVARFIAGTDLGSMPPAALEQATRCLIDGFGVTLAGSTLHGSAIVRDYVRRASDSNGEATLVGAESFMATVPHAAL